MLPAYLPNPIAALFGGGLPVDLGRSFSDGRRILGNGKTYRGLFIGIFAGIAIGFVQIYCSSAYSLTMLPVHTIVSVTALSVGALLGDLVKSFFKRRLGMERGESWFIADQYDFAAGALLLTLMVAPDWLLANLTLPVFIIILIITPLLHRLVNIIGYYSGVKDVPW
jgi:CDP-2,3-bis-(O-geranylgeranyl)-sn-glycerol synthase